MAMVMYLFTCGFVCDNSNVYSTCSIHTDSKCIIYSNAYTSKHDIGINVHQPLTESCKASIMWRYTEEHNKVSVHWHTISDRSHWSQ